MPQRDLVHLFELTDRRRNRLCLCALGNRNAHQLAVMRVTAVVSVRLMKDHFVGTSLGGATADVRQGNNAYQVPISTVEDRQTMYMILVHDGSSLFDRIILEAEKYFGRHRFAHGHLTDVSCISDAPHRDIAVREHPDHARVLAHRQRANVFAPQLAGCRVERFLRLNADWLFHHFSD